MKHRLWSVFLIAMLPAVAFATTTTTTSSVSFAGGDGTVAFPYTFPTVSSSDLVVTITVDATGVTATKTLTTHYATTVGASGGTVTMVTAPATGETLTIQRVTPKTQLLSLTPGGAFNPTVLTASFDKLTRIVQEIFNLNERNLRAPSVETSLNMELPSAVDRASLYLAFSAAGEPVAIAGTDDPNGLLDDYELAALATVESAEDRVFYFTGHGTADYADSTAAGRAAWNVDPNALDLLYFPTTSTAGTLPLSAFVRTLLNDANAPDFLTTIDPNLTAFAGLTSAADKLPYFTGAGTMGVATFTAYARTLLDDANSADFLTTLDPNLTAFAGLTSAADKLPYFTGAGTMNIATFTAFARTILDDANEAVFKATVNLEIGTDVQAYDPNLAAIAGLTTSANQVTYWTGAGTAAQTNLTAFGRSIIDDDSEAVFKATVNLEIGTDVQAYDADLTTWAGLTPTAFFQTLPNDANALIYAASTKQDQSIDVRWHGTTGSGDQYAALQAAITDAITGEMGVTIPPGTYRLETGLAIGAGAWEGGLVLDGIGWPKFDWAGAVGGTVLTLTSINESRLSGFIVDGNNIADVNGIRLTTAAATSGQRNTFTNVTVWDCPGYGIHVVQEPDATGDHFVFINSLAYDCGTGVRIEGGAREVQFSSGTIAGNTVGVDVNGGRFVGYGVTFGDNGTDMVISDWLSRIQLYGCTSESDVILTTSGRAYDGDLTLSPNIIMGLHQAEFDSPPTTQVIDYNAYEPILFIGNRFQHDVNMYSQCQGYVSLLNEFSAGDFIGTGADKCLIFTPVTNHLGVGESAPEYRLHVNSGTANNAALLESTDAGVLLMMRDNTTTAGVSTEALGRIGDELDLRTNGTARLKISGTAPTQGYVAIGYEHFHNMLDVAGDINVPTGSGYLVNGVPLYDAADDGFVDGNDTAYDVSSWDNNVNAPTMNTIRDKFNGLAASNLTNGTVGTGAVVLATNSALVGGATLDNGATSAGYMDIKEDSSNGTSRVRLTVSADVPADKTVNIGLVDQCLASGTVNMQAGDAKTTVYTVPAGLSAIVTRVIIYGLSGAVGGGGTDFDIGDGANADTWKTAINLSSMTATSDCIVITLDNTKYTRFDAADQFGIKPVTGYTNDVTATMMVFGVEISP